MNRALCSAVVIVSFCAPHSVWAQKPASLAPEAFDATLHYQTGTIALGDGLATVRVPASFRFLGREGSRRLVTQGWGNPPAAAAGVMGMLIPRDINPLARDGWGIIITYEEDGFVDDSDAASIDYDRLLEQLQKATRASNHRREQAGFAPITLIGWAEPPRYDAGAHKLYWAKELASGDRLPHTLNYDIRVLGRRGVLVLTGVAGMNQLSTIRSRTADVLAAIDFNQGHRYADYLPGRDQAAAYGVAGLIVGAAAVKGGLFKVLLAALLAFKKVIVVVFIALMAAIRRLFGGAPAASAEAGSASDSPARVTIS